MQKAPGRIDDLVRFARALDKGDNQSNLGRYSDIVTHMDAYAKMSDAGWNMMQAEQSQSDFKMLSKERAGYLNAPDDQSSGGINTRALALSLNSALAGLGIDTKPTTKDLAGRERLGGIQQAARVSLFDAQRQAGRKFTADEVEQHINVLFSKSIEFKRTVFGIDSKVSQNMMSCSAVRRSW